MPAERRDGVEYVAGDLATGAGVAAAVAGVATIVHCAGSAKGDDVKARHLVDAAVRAGAKHLVYISVVGAERVPVRSAADRAMFGYFAAKRAAELLVAESGIPFTTLRASQFHELTLATVRQMAKLPVVPVPAGVRFQPVDGAEVAARLAELALGEPAGLVPDLAGPRIYGMDELVRSTCAPPAGGARCCACEWAGAPTAPCGPAPTSRPTAPSAAVRGRSSWPPTSSPRRAPRSAR
ncbi:SDR family oxidoreductase [Dactylosporangium darangshiense]|uniref:SDR family oxidoreductase n=1 Tax=Dactylosporangium darangshiense TaxID=579108 RepID=UPI0036374669